MATFTDKQQKHHRADFIEDCRQKAWNAACNNADYGAKRFDELLAEYEKMRKEDAEHEEQIKALDSALDYHTKDNREKRKALQERRTILAKQLQFLEQSSAEAQQVMQQL
jgi:lantibiotic modifying enzyme